MGDLSSQHVECFHGLESRAVGASRKRKLSRKSADGAEMFISTVVLFDAFLAKDVMT